MKNLQRQEEGVSPVIGVILMVAITVVLAAVVFVMVNQFGAGGDEAPSVAFNRDEARDQITLTKAEGGLSWDQFQVKLSVDGEYALNGAATVAVGAGNVTDFASATTVTGGDELAFCGDAAAQNVVVTIIHAESNAQIYRTEFASIEAC